MIVISEEEFKHLAHYIKAQFGINLKQEKKTLLVARLQRHLLEQGFDSFAQYLQHIKADSSGASDLMLANRITTNHTFFMREANHFYYLRDKVLPIIVRTIRDYDLRIWSAGCSSGEEPYTLAILLDEFFGPRKQGWNTQVLATDLSAKVLEIAAKGTYSNDALDTVPALWRSSYFRKLNEEQSVVLDKVKLEVIFRQFNLMQKTFPFKRKFHVIFCRNVMIYFDHETKRELIRKFYEMTEPGGYLFIGHSESLERDKTEYAYIMPSVYRKEL
ncbi:protein-glutamate O-methyltransferase CheR [Bacillus sp. FJAT-26390]|uniref:CheR family methyltransferase n=1 Tax=Bacillus sp. FJAT-26390 TaxID=1743142 RepID=UPI000807BBDE|nr:protein-glutamate O-methyltransferase CheR [Bacillus sp. FJAT-26390]OBZ07803.1 chemotaxis protein CheR [Bacillus sp. FJAT-26390]